MKKRLLISSTDLMMIQFLVPHVQYLFDNGFEIELACSDVGGRMDEVRQKLSSVVQKIHTVRLHRSPVNPENLKGYRDMRKVIEQGQFDIIWTNEPVMGVVTRLAARKARKRGTKVLYMVHGFHFFRGAPIANWLVYYPIEKLMASKADTIVTINQEDYQKAKSFRVNDVRYIHGIGINTDRLQANGSSHSVREELGIPADAFILLSVGELNQNKNQKVILEAVARLNDRDIHYLLCGKGDELSALKARATSLGISDRVYFLGYRKDVYDIYQAADLFAMPSLREGLPVAALEAMYSELPIVNSNIRGLLDITEDGVSGYVCNPNDTSGFAEGIKQIKDNPSLRKQMSARNKEVSRAFQIENTKAEVLEVINSI